MRLTTSSQLISLVCLLNFYTPAHALSEIRILSSDTYQKTEREYVASTGTKVEVKCEAGDELVDGACFGEEKMKFASESEHGIFLNSEQVEKNGWSCSPKVLHPPQVLRVDSIVTCKKSKS